MLRWNAFPFIRYVAALTGGIVAYLLFPSLKPVLCTIYIVSTTIFILSFFVKSIQWHTLKGVTGLFVFNGFGWLITSWHTASNDPINLIHGQRPIRAYEAVVGSQAENRTKTFRVELEVRRIRTDSAWQPASGRLIVYLDKSVPDKPRYGDVWLVRGQPRPIDPPLNPGEFNYKRFLANRGIYYQQYLRPSDRRVTGYQPLNQITALAYTINDWADSVYTANLGSGAEFAIVKAMILGIRDGIDPELQQAYSAAGAVHILSVSGLHVGVLFSALSLLLGFLRKRKGGTYAFAALMLGLLWFYALMTGFSAPVLRSAFMFSLLLIGQTIGRANTPLNTLAASAFLILLFDPYALTTAGFQLSYLAVGGLLIGYQPFYQLFTASNWLLDQLWRLTAMALVAQLVTFPLGVFYFHQFPTYFWLANPVVVPLSSVVLMLAMGLLAVGWIPFVGVWVGKILFGAMWLLNQAILLTEQLPNALIAPLTVTGWELIWLYAVLVFGIALALSREKRCGWLLVGSSILLTSLVGWTTVGRKHQRLLVVHFVPHESAISLVAGKSAVFLTKDTLTDQSREVRFYVKNTWDSLGISRVVYTRPQKMTPSLALYQNRSIVLIRWQGRSVLLINRIPKRRFWRVPMVVDYAIISRNAIQSWDQLKGRVAARHLIFDDSNKTPLTDRLLAEARQRGISCHSVRQQGAYLVRL
ncbi:ComEC/Rec2 family competence protein [Larkinella sp. VNQ87]|uniref:ComEC/Rec2 family competence protein n=1 Tax=Larkinella sp. VNQ87 TaxID=3400921 RepID=UPI003C05EFF7